MPTVAPSSNVAGSIQLLAELNPQVGWIKKAPIWSVEFKFVNADAVNAIAWLLPGWPLNVLPKQSEPWPKIHVSNSRFSKPILKSV